MIKNIQISTFGLALVLFLTSCNQNNSQAESTTSSSSTPTQSKITTNVLNPTPIRITIDSLPQPFATQSASNSPNVISVPENPTLNVPAGFQVNVFAEGLEQPRWMALTPDGDVLVAESRSDRIRLLQDRNGDGVAETKQVFGTSENGLDQPFGMTFVSNNFYVANTGEKIF
jgi:glucose/arabinose dehydrogenase